jgi:hypothetical protein
VLRELDADFLGANQRELLELRATAARMVDRITAIVRGHP